ncbi:hypothetical protein D3C74_419570 [compost metagenome]
MVVMYCRFALKIRLHLLSGYPDQIQLLVQHLLGQCHAKTRILFFHLACTTFQLLQLELLRFRQFQQLFIANRKVIRLILL